MKRRLDTSLGGLLLNQFIEFWYFYIGAFVCLYATHEIQSYLPFVAKELADIIQNGVESIEVMKFVYLAIGIVFFRTSSRLLFFYPARVLQKYMRVEMLDRLSKATPFRYKSYSSGQIFQVMSGDLEEMRAMIGFALLQIGNIIIALFVLIPKLNNYSSHLLIALLPMLIAFILFVLIVSRNKKYFRLIQDMQGDVNNFIIETYSGKKTIKNYHAEKSFIELFRNNCSKELGYFFKAGIGIAISMPFIPLGVGFSLIWGAHLIQLHQLGASSIILFSGFVFLFLEPLAFVSWIGIVFARSAGAWGRIKELINEMEKESPVEEKLRERNTNGVDNVILEFWGKDLSFHIQKNAWNVLIGKTGHGKTHLIHQLAEVLKNKDKSLSYVAQVPYLYNDSIEKNIFLGHEPSVDDKEKAIRLLKLFGLDYLESSFEKLLSMEVGENGKRLSGGQQKRLALVRSIMSGADYLIWDDPFSSVDLILEKEITTQLQKSEILKNKTVILTSHRLSTVKSSQKVFFIDKEEGMKFEDDVESALKEGSVVYEYFEGQLI